jgi:hypothetical protein
VLEHWWRRRVSSTALSHLRLAVSSGNSDRFGSTNLEAVDWPKPDEASRAIAEYLAALDEARGTEDSDHGDHDRKPPKQISLTDPQAAWVTRKKMSPFFAYNANYLIDNKLGIIVDAEGTREETAVTETMIARVAGRYDLSKEARSRYCLWDRVAAEMAHRSRHRATHPGLGQVAEDEWPLHARRLLL